MGEDMNDASLNPPAKWFYVVSAIAFVWNLLGVAAYIVHVRMTQADIAALPEAEQLLYASAPAWATGAFAFAVFGGTLGCLGLLLRKRWAFPLFVLSLLGIIAQRIYDLFFSNVLEVYGPGSMIMPALVLIIAVYLIFFARSSSAKGWLN